MPCKAEFSSKGETFPKSNIFQVKSIIETEYSYSDSCHILEFAIVFEFFFSLLALNFCNIIKVHFPNKSPLSPIRSQRLANVIIVQATPPNAINKAQNHKINVAKNWIKIFIIIWDKNEGVVLEEILNSLC